jgi:arylsulfatase A-like enzyme
LLYGESAEERPSMAIKNPVSVIDLHATIMHIMGVSPKTAFEVERRPFYVTEDGKGVPVMDVLS